MPKFWLPAPAELHEIHTLVKEDDWFLLNQRMLLGLVNTNFGRDMLGIPKEYPRIVKIRKNCVHALRYYDKQTGLLHMVADFRIGAKLSNAIRQHWAQFNSYARYFISKNPHDEILSRMTRYARAVHASTLTVYPDPNPETSTFDGFVAHDNATYATSHDASTGTLEQSDSATSFRTYNQPAHSIARVVVLWDTSSLTAGATISAAVASIAFVSGENPDADSIRMTLSDPASNTGITNTDYAMAKFGTTAQANDVLKSALSASTYADFTLTSTGRGNISKTSISKFGFRQMSDVNSGASTGANQSLFSSADTALTTLDPKLVVTYTIVVTDGNFFLF